MAAVLNKELLSRETLESAVPTSSAGAPMLEFPEQPQKEQEKQQQTPSDSLQIVIEGDGENHEDEETRSPDFDWVGSIKKKIEQAGQEDKARSWSKLSIYRVPHYLREVDNKAYVPRVISLGPYHHGKKHLRKMDKHKWRCLHHVMQRPNQDIKLYLDTAREMEAKARSCYEGPINLSSNQFVEMMVLDGCFMLELFQGFADDYPRNDPVFASMDFIKGDMIMLENQLPLFVLDRFLRLQLNNSYQKGLLAQLALEFFDPLTPTPMTEREGTYIAASFAPLSVLEDLHCLNVFRKSLLRPGPKPQSVQGGLHCLHVFRKSLLRLWSKPRSVLGGLHCLHVFRKSLLRLWSKPRSVLGGLHCLHVFRKSLLRLWSKPRSVLGGLHCLHVFRKSLLRLWTKPQSVHHQSIPCVTELREAGIKFRKRKTDRFWDVKFKKGILRVPTLLIDDGTKSLFLNLIALEQCHTDCGNEITSFVVFMDNLINSPEDVAYLHYCGIIDHGLGSDADVADLFNQLCQQVVININDSYLSQLFKDVNHYYNNKWHTWRASLKHKYFSNPWAIISLFAAVVLLLLTFTQTFFGVYAYYRPRS
ncbi:hypothetical protein DKX38_011249 [Salix brachista]|uniref:Uncharacterized protein n=1 Tax=Salix brachista TaxID=2182728 RepID=A0A5N5M0V8_9ROSI|nr:hypothetical protein DKX38_011249 [Salix brachista]